MKKEKKNHDFIQLTSRGKTKSPHPVTSEAFSFLPRIWNAVKCGYSLTKGAQTSTDSHISDNGHSSCLLVQKKRKDWDYPQGMFVSWASDSAWIKREKKKEKRIPQSLSSELRHSVCVYHFLRAEGHCETTMSLSKVVCASLGLLQHFQFFTLMNWSHPPRLSLVFS